jgi:hypothetical protein
MAGSASFQHASRTIQESAVIVHHGFWVRAVRRHMRGVCALAALTIWDACAIATHAQTRPSEPRVTDAAITEVDPVVGTWELDTTASTFAPGPPPKSEIRLYEPEHEGIKATVVTIYADGRRSIFEYVTSYNDVIAAVTGSDTSDAIRMRKVDTFTAEAELSLAGRNVGRTRRVISQDGQTMTIELHRTAPVVVNNVTVYRRR